MGDFATTTSISELVPFFLASNTTTSDAGGTAIFSRHIDRAEGVVKSYASIRYDVDGFRVGTTTTNVPPLLRTLSEDIASYFAIRGAYVQDGGRRQEYLATYERAMDLLIDIRDGKTKLAYTDGSEVPVVATSRFLSSTLDYAHVFNLDEETAWRVDPDQLDDISNGR